MAPIFSTNNFQVIEHGIRDTTNTPAVSLVVQTTDADTTKLNHPRTIYQVADKAARDGWLKKLGFLVSKYHAEYLGCEYPPHNCQVLRTDIFSVGEYTGNPHDVTLQDFPPNYEMFMDISPERKDLYLCGKPIPYHIHPNPNTKHRFQNRHQIPLTSRIPPPFSMANGRQTTDKSL